MRIIGDPAKIIQRDLQHPGQRGSGGEARRSTTRFNPAQRRLRKANQIGQLFLSPALGLPGRDATLGNPGRRLLKNFFRHNTLRILR